MSSSKIPQIDSIDVLAHFWDSHDLTDFEEELEEAPEPVFDRETIVKVRLPLKEADTLKNLANAQGVHDADLVRQWVLERIHTI